VGRSRTSGKKKDNLRPFKRGFDPRRNLRGPFVNAPWSKEIEEFCREKYPYYPKAGTFRQAVIRTLMREAIKGNPTAAKLLIETEQGKAAQRVEVTGRERGPVKITLQETLRTIAEVYGVDPAKFGAD
jgi:hypothetical protein